MQRLPTYRLLLVHRSSPALIAGVGALFAAVRLDGDLLLTATVATGFGVLRAIVHLRDATFSAARAKPAPTEPVQAAASLKVGLPELGFIALCAVLTLAISQFGGSSAALLSSLLAGMLMGEAGSYLAVVTWVTAFERAERVLLVCRDAEPDEPRTALGREVTPLYRVEQWRT